MKCLLTQIRKHYIYLYLLLEATDVMYGKPQCFDGCSEPCPLISVPSVRAAVLAEPLLQRRLPEDPVQIPVEPAAGQPLPDPTRQRPQISTRETVVK